MSILLIDSYDSFTHNLRDLIQTSLPSDIKIHTIYNDSVSGDENTITKHLATLQNNYQCIIIGPGPGDPNQPENLGIISPILKHCTNVPILGICLGFQAMGMLSGAKVERLENVKHGQISSICILEEDPLLKFFQNGYNSVRYHSLHTTDYKNSELIPLAVTEDDEKILMAGRHVKYPYFGVQYHPESIYSDHGDLLIKNFFQNIVVPFNEKYPKQLVIDSLEPYYVNSQLRLGDHVYPNAKDFVIPKSFWHREFNESSINYNQISYTTKKDLGINIIESLKGKDMEHFLLNSSADPKTHSIIGFLESSKTLEISWSLNCPKAIELNLWKSETVQTVNGEIWSFLQELMSQHHLLNSPIVKRLNLPFIGGLMGSISYESGQYIDTSLAAKRKNHKIPDIKMAFIEKSVIVDEVNNVITIISLNDQSWVDETTTIIENILKQESIKLPSKVSEIYQHEQSNEKVNITLPKKETYYQQFHKCQYHLHSGDSYELCLCCLTQIEFPESVASWELFKLVNSKNPAPFAGYMPFKDLCLISSSPERFFSWKNDYYKDSDNFDFNKKGQLRPIKGTVKKTPTLTYGQVENILHSPKELGENLMIVDLIRHDLYSHCSQTLCPSLATVSNVNVSKLMQIEEYQTVYQLVSVIECDITSSDQYEVVKESRGFQILSTSLPPGSMTGAPKKRSVSILQDLESSNRGVYSGVFGYWSLCDQGDWSVVIRSIFTHDPTYKHWTIGAGGAITVLSTDNGEWEEMLVKLSSILQIFDQCE